MSPLNSFPFSIMSYFASDVNCHNRRSADIHLDSMKSSHCKIFVVTKDVDYIGGWGAGPSGVYNENVIVIKEDGSWRLVEICPGDSFLMPAVGMTRWINPGLVRAIEYLMWVTCCEVKRNARDYYVIREAQQNDKLYFVIANPRRG